MTSRFIDKGLTIHDFLTDIWVFCPKCNEIAHIRDQNFFCSHCKFQLNKLVQPNSCINCGKPLYHKNDAEKYQFEENFICSYCGAKNNINELNEILKRRQDREAGYDPYYGLELVLQKDVGSHTLWFYNPSHLFYIELFLQAKLKEKLAEAGNDSIISRLPAWIKSPKNGKSLLKAIQYIKTKFSLTTPLVIHLKIR